MTDSHYHGDSVLLKEVRGRLERLFSAHTPPYLCPMLKSQADERLALIFHRTESDDTREAVALLRMALKALK